MNDRNRRQSFELEVAAASSLPGAGSPRRTTVQLLGEAKASRLDAEALARLDRIAELLDERKGVSLAPTAKRMLFSVQGFSTDLESTALRRPEVELIDLDRLYEGT